MAELVVIYQGEDACTLCLGWKRVAEESGESWKYWAELPAPSNIAVQMGIVKPVDCPRCYGTGIEPELIGKQDLDVELLVFRALRSDPSYSYAGTFPINRAAIESRNKEIDTLREQLSNVTSRAMRNIMDERVRQDIKWGEQNHDPYTYLTILMEEVGEYAQACLHTQFGGKNGGIPPMREEAVQVAAVALAIIECLDRGKYHWPTKENIKIGDK